jgi:triphosphatase
MSAATTAKETPMELELKLVGTKAALRSAEARIARHIGTPVDWSTDRLQTTYFDTVDRRLSRRGVAVRVRKKNRDHTLTVKASAGDAQAISARPEWNVAISGAQPDLSLLPADARTRVGLVLPGELRSLFTVDVERKKAVVDLDDGITQIEIAIDRGEVRAGRKKSELLELELEIISGPPQAVFDLASVLADCGLRLGQVTKAQRGFALIDGAAAATPHRAPKFRLRRRQKVTDAVSEILTAGLSNVLANEAACLEGTDPEGVHQMRVSLRRMRSMFSVFRHSLDAERCAWAKEELKWLANSLGPARDWDVFIDEILGPVAGTGIDPSTVAALVTAAEQKRNAGYAQARDAIQSPRYTKLILGLSRFVEDHGWVPDGGSDALRMPLGDISDTMLTRAFKRLKKRGHNLAEMDVPARHEVRIELKKFRYSLDFLNALYPAAQVRPFMKTLAVMQDVFGHLNDVAVAETLLDELVSEKGLSALERRLRHTGSGKILGWHARGLHDLEDEFIDDWNDLITARVFWKKGKGGK